MTTVSIGDPEGARSYIKGLKLPPPPPRVATRGREDEEAAGIGGDLGPALAIGSLVTEFGDGVAPAVRQEVVNSFLVAQLAANCFIQDVGGGPVDWYERFFYVLANSGWNVERSEDKIQDSAGNPQEIHRVIVPTLAAALGDALAATSTVLAVLKGLSAASANSPWVTLFQRESQRASANQFQVGYVAGRPGAPARRGRPDHSSFEAVF